VPTNGGFAYPDVTAAEEESERRLRSRAEREMRRVAGIFTEAGFDVTDQLAMGPPSEQLLKEAESGTFDLVAVGSRGLGPVRRVLLGSVSDHVARLARAAFVARSVT
jgi:nucleotide-binding universal stress UspA family protein